MRRRLLSGLTLLTTMGLATWCLLPNTIIARNTDVDESAYLMVARLIHHGSPRHAFFFDQFWLFPDLLATAFKLFGDSLIVGRMTTFALSFAGVIGVARLSYQLGGKWIATAATIVVTAINPLYIRQSRMAMADVPAMTCIVWALVFAFLFKKDRRRIWLALSGTFVGMSIILKPFAVGLVVTVVIVLFAQRIGREHGRLKLDRAIVINLLIFSAFAFAAMAPFVDFLHPIAEFRRTVGFHWQEKNWLIKRVDDRWLGLWRFGQLNIPLLVFAVSGIAALRPLSIPLIALLTGELVTTAILLEMPPWLHHYVLLLPPLVLFSVLGFNRGFRELKCLILRTRTGPLPNSPNHWIAILFACAVLISLIDLPWVIRFDRRACFPQPIRLDSVVQYVEQNFGPNQYLLSDDPLVPYLAGRILPPASINFIWGDVLRFDSTSWPRLEQVIRENNVTGIIVITRYERNARLMSWINTNFPVSTQLEAKRADELSARVYRASK